MVTFVTTNAGKVTEAQEYLDDPVEQVAFDYPERQADDLATVAAHGARTAYRHVGGPVIVDDSGLTIDALDGFPGPYSSYVEDTLGIERVWNLVADEDDRSAAFRGVIAYCDGDPFEATPEPVDTDRRGDDIGKLPYLYALAGKAGGVIRQNTAASLGVTGNAMRLSRMSPDDRPDETSSLPVGNYRAVGRLSNDSQFASFAGVCVTVIRARPSKSTVNCWQS